MEELKAKKKQGGCWKTEAREVEEEEEEDTEHEGPLFSR